MVLLHIWQHTVPPEMTHYLEHPGAFHRSFYTCPNVYFWRTFRFTIEVLPEDVSLIGAVVVDTDDVKLCRATIAEVDRLGLEVLKFRGVEVLG